MAVRDYNSAYYDPYGDYQYEIDKLNQLQQQDPELATQYAQLGGNMAGMYAANKIPGVLSSALPTSIGTPVAGAGPIATPTASAPTVSAAPGLFSGVAPMAGSTLGLGALAGIGGGIALGAKGAKDLFQGNKTKGLEGWGGRATLGIATGGLSELARALGVFGHKSTRDVARANTKGLMSQAPEDQKWQNYVAGMREQYNSAPTDPSKPFAGKYASWDEYKKAGLDATDLTGVVGNLKAYGPQYAGLSFDQQKALTQKNIDAGNYSSKKGEVNINDEAKAKSFLDELLKANKK